MELNTRKQNKQHILLHEIRSIFSPWRAHSLVYRIYTSENWGCFISCIRMHWWRSIAACRAQTCWVYLSLVFFLTWQEHSTALERNPNVLTMLHHLHLFSRQGQCPEQCLWWWRESFVKCTDGGAWAGRAWWVLHPWDKHLSVFGC